MKNWQASAFAGCLVEAAAVVRLGMRQSLRTASGSSLHRSV